VDFLRDVRVERFSFDGIRKFRTGSQLARMTSAKFLVPGILEFPVGGVLVSIRVNELFADDGKVYFRVWT
jgi:hypothetical protein